MRHARATEDGPATLSYYCGKMVYIQFPEGEHSTLLSFRLNIVTSAFENTCGKQQLTSVYDSHYRSILKC